MTRLSALDLATYALPPEVLSEVQSPALVVYLGHVRANVARVLRDVGDPARWRVHVKTSKIPRVWAELPRAGLRRFKCATTREAQHLGAVLDEAGVEGDVLVAYPLREPSLSRLSAIAAAHPRHRWSVLCEDPDLVAAIPPDLGVFVDLDPGMCRTGIPTSDRGEITAVCAGAGTRLRGLHYYDGHLHDGTLEERGARARDGYDDLIALLQELRAAGHALSEVVTSGTPVYRRALEYGPLAEIEDVEHTVSPGTVVYHDWCTEQQNPDLDLTPAAVVLARIVSWPGRGVVTCDAGSKAIAAEAGDPCAYAVGHPELRGRVPNEEHLPFDVLSGERPARGTPLYLVPQHVCPTVNLAEHALLVEEDGSVEVADVSARAHDLGLGLPPTPRR